MAVRIAQKITEDGQGVELRGRARHRGTTTWSATACAQGISRRRRWNIVAVGGGSRATDWSTSCSSTRPGRWRWQTCWPWRARPARSSCSAIRSSSTSPSRAPIRRVPIALRWRTCSTGRPRSGRAGALPRAHVPASSRCRRLHLRGVLRRPARVAAGPREPAIHGPRRCAAAGCASSRRTTSVPIASRGPRRSRWRASSARSPRAARPGWTATGTSTRSPTGRAGGRAVQRPGRADRQRSCRRRRGSGRSTSSRARRRRSASTR